MLFITRAMNIPKYFLYFVLSQIIIAMDAGPSQTMYKKDNKGFPVINGDTVATTIYDTIAEKYLFSHSGKQTALAIINKIVKSITWKNLANPKNTKDIEIINPAYVIDLIRSAFFIYI